MRTLSFFAAKNHLIANLRKTPLPLLHRINPIAHSSISSLLSPLRRSLHDLPSNPQTSDLFFSPRSRILQSTPTQLEDSNEEDDPMNEFLSRFVWAIRGKLAETFPGLDRQTLDGMLLVICQKVVAKIDQSDADQSPAAADMSLDLSEDLWKTIWEVSKSVHEAMRRDRVREELKKYLHCDEVKEMCRFAGDVGIRGEFLRELRFKWAREKLDEVEFYRNLERMREEAGKDDEVEKVLKLTSGGEASDGSLAGTEKDERSKVASLPQRRGKIKYKIYGLDLSDPKWAEVAERVEEAEKHIIPHEPHPIEGKCKRVEEKIFALNPKKDDPSPVLEEWAEALQPRRVDWLALLERIKERNVNLYYKVAELLISEKSIEANIRDYSKLIDAYSKADRIADAERILNKMIESGIEPDILTSLILLHMYSKAGNLDRARDAFETLRTQGFQPDIKAYISMISAYVKAGLPEKGESLTREMEARDIKPTKEIYMELLRAFAERGLVKEAQKIVNMMLFAGIEPTLESSTLLVEAYGQDGDPDQARGHFDHMLKTGHKPDDRCTASMMAAYVKKNLLDKALDLLLTLEKDGFRPGVATYTVLVDWLGRLQLVEEAERVLGMIAELGEDLPFEVHVSLCDMYSRVGKEKEMKKALKILEGRKKLLRGDQFERVVSGLLAGGFVGEAKRIYDVMQELGLSPSEPVRVALMAAQSMNSQRPGKRR